MMSAREAFPLEVQEVAKAFGSRPALAGVTFAIAPGEIFGLLGPNGAGKTTLVRGVAGRVIPDAGTLSIFGRSPAESAARALRGWVPQEIALYPLLSPRENLRSFGRFQGLSGERLESAIRANLEWVGLSDRADERTEGLSGGMKRRLNIAAGTIHEPKLLLLDEPTVGVDPQSRERIYAMIQEVKARGVSLLYTTHYMEEAERLCDRIAIIDHGRIIAEGTKDQLVRQTLGAAQTVVIDTEAPIPDRVRATLARFGADVDGMRVQASVEDAAARIRELLEVFHDSGVRIRDLTLKAATLEEVFLHLTGRELRE